MIELLVENPVLLLFVVASLGYLVGTFKVRGQSLGVAAILFMGLLFGAIHPQLQIPEITLILGLSIFVYSIGLSSGPAFFSSYRENGYKDFLFVFLMILLSGVIAAVIWVFAGFSPGAIAGIYSGSTTNTAALAGVIDLINNSKRAADSNQMIEDVVVGYTFSYPIGVLGSMIAIVLMERILKIDYQKEAKELRKIYPLEPELFNAILKVTNPALCNIPLRDLMKTYDWNIVFGRHYSKENVSLANWNTIFQVGDSVTLVGNEEDINQVIGMFGETGDVQLSYDRSAYDVKRIFVSNPIVSGRSIASLNLQEEYDAMITRIRRGDIDMLATGDTVLELGDRVRFVARKSDMKALSELFGDSYYQSSKINLFTFGLGIGIGLILGTIEFNIGPGISFKLGYAGGPLVVGLALGALRRTGPIIWTLPYSANVTLQQIGLILLLSTIGVRSGNAFVQSLSIEGVYYFLAGTIISLLTAIAILLVGYKVVKKPFVLLMGMVANQPAILDFASSRAKNRIPEIGYSMMFPIALISKIVIAQILFLVLS